ncbi:MAG: SDR family NAD(P)-dependent oxidoreductase [Vulcanimicrobiaceae bacterium]
MRPIIDVIVNATPRPELAEALRGERVEVAPLQRAMVVTGASSGIGAALATQAAAANFAVLLVARRAERLAQIAHAIRGGGGVCEVLVADVVADDAPARIVDAAIRAFGRIDIVVNNAGTGAPGLLLEQSDAAIGAQWQLHVAAPLRITRAALPHLRAVQGGVAFVGSGLARVPAPGFGAYCIAKAAVRAAAAQLRRELRRDGVAVSYVDPGAVDTEFSEASGMQRSSADFSAGPERVAAKILRGLQRRSARINAVPWQTAAVALAEWFPALADAAMGRIVDTPAPTPMPGPAPSPAMTLPPPLPANGSQPASGFAAALEPVARRMERVKLSPEFLRAALVPGATITLHDLAMRWAGMPNKHERAAMHEVLDALAKAGYLTLSGEETWLVAREAD